jgi:hypothetical protein
MSVPCCRSPLFSEKVNKVGTVLSSFGRFQALVHDDKWICSPREHREVFQRATTGRGICFPSLSLYNGLQFGGDPYYVACADFNATGACADTQICVRTGLLTRQMAYSRFDIGIVSVVIMLYGSERVLQCYCCGTFCPLNRLSGVAVVSW